MGVFRRTFAVLLIAYAPLGLRAQSATQIAASSNSVEAMDRDLLEVTIPQLREFYRAHRYTVTQVVQWYMARIDRYNGIYLAVQNVDTQAALATAAREDAEGAIKPPDFSQQPMWGVPVVTKANTSVRGLITTDGWSGYMLNGHELVAPRSAVPATPTTFASAPEVLPGGP